MIADGIILFRIRIFDGSKPMVAYREKLPHVNHCNCIILNYFTLHSNC